MAKENQLPKSKPSDADLLSDAIPIDQVDESAEEPKAAPEAPPVPDAIDIVDSGTTREIRRFESKIKREEKVGRKSNADGHGATRVKTFVAKLRLDAIDNMDEMINQWLTEHPDYEVKHSTAVIGMLQGKLAEPALFVCVWV